MTTTMLETYDTQMLDYQNDIDVPMHASSDPWFQDEAAMEDDAQHLHAQKIPLGDHESNISVEVDMEPYDEDHTEYEMADGAENYELEGPELVDVEVYDASHAHTPAATQDTDAPPPPPSGFTDSTHTLPPFTEPLVSDIPQGKSEELVGSSSPLFTPVIEGPQTTSPYHFHQELPDDATHHIENFDTAEFSASHVEDPASEHNAVEGAPHIIESAELASDSNSARDTQQNTDSARDESHVHEPAAQNVDALHADHHSAYPDVVPSAERPDIDEHDTSELHHEPQDDVQAVGDTTDPHEISEGVYIDPPPPVFLSLLSSDQPEISLFNRPQSRPGSASPIVEGTPASPQALTLLLHHLPTLYYEPLVSVFEALRQEEYIARIPEFADGELVIDAYDLQLVISEDNLYAREVTLHDLNVLHDGSDISGPLRLRLQSVVPRFIVRYHLLQDQVARLNLAVEGTEEPIEPAVDQEHYLEDHNGQETAPESAPEPLGEHPEVQTENEHVEQELGLTEVQDAPHQEDPQVQETTDNQHDNVEPTGELSNLTAEHEHHEVLGDPVQDELEYVDEDVTTTHGINTDVAGDGLGADSIPGGTDTDPSAPVGEEYTEYEEYTELHEEGDESFPDLPDEEEDGTDLASNLDSKPLHDSPEFLRDSLEEPATVESATPRQVESVLAPEDDADQNTGNENDTDYNEEKGYEEITKTLQEGDPDEIDSISKQTNLEVQSGVDDSDSNFVALLEQEADQTDPPADPPSSEVQAHQEVAIAEPDNYAEEDWDDNLDGEGDPDTTWEAEHETASNESSVTLSSKTSSKRSFGEVEDEEELEGASPPSSPGSKRPRVH